MAISRVSRSRNAPTVGHQHALERIVAGARRVLGLGGGRWRRLGARSAVDRDADQRRGRPSRNSRASRPSRGRRPRSAKPADDEQHAGGRDQHADAIGRDIGRHAGGLLASRAGFRCGRRRSGCPGSRLRSRPAARRRTPPARRTCAGSHSPSTTIAAIIRSCENTSQPRRRPSQARQQRHVERVDHRRPQELDRCRACRPARTGRWCRDRRRSAASTAAASSRTAPAAGPAEKPRNSTISTRGLR